MRSSAPVLEASAETMSACPSRRVGALLLDFGALVALEQRVALQLLVDEGLQFHVGHLQQLDGLLQLRRHHQGLALAEVEPLVQRHGARQPLTG